MRYYLKSMLVLLCWLLCAETGFAAGTAEDKNSIPSIDNQNYMQLGGTHLRHGDPGWVRKMARRRLLRLKAAEDKTALAALQTDHFYLPVLLGSFSDKQGSHSVEDFQNLYFENNSAGTMTDYFNEVSYGQLILSGSVYGWFEVDNPVDYYSETAWDSSSFPQNIDGFVTDAVSRADQFVDFSQYDNDGPDNVPNSGDDDGYVDALMIVYAGEYGENNLRGVQGSLGGWGGGSVYTTDDPSLNGENLKIRTFTLVPELVESDLTIAVACHEFAHVLGLPDLYDYTLRSVGLGRWCLMAGLHILPGETPFPSHLSAWCKIQLGWATPVEINENKTISIDPVETSPAVYKIWEDGYGLSRYFLLENRQKTGFDARLPGSGLLIYHVDDNQWFGTAYGGGGSQNSDFTHKLVDLEEADGKRDLDYWRSYGDAGDPFPGTSNNRTFDDLSNPDSRDYDGNSTGVAIRNIGYSIGTRMKADITVRTPLGYSLAYDLSGITGRGWDDETYWGGVLFKAGEPGILAALDIGFAYDIEEYKIKIYKAVIDSIPQDLIATVSGKYASPGWHTIELNGANLTIEKDQEFFVCYSTSRGLWVDPYSEYAGRSYYSYDGVYFFLMPDQGYGIFNIRARIRTEGFVLCDFNEDGSIDKKDVIALLKYLYENPGDLKADFNRDGKASILDAIALLLAQRNGTCPENFN